MNLAQIGCLAAGWMFAVSAGSFGREEKVGSAFWATIISLCFMLLGTIR